MIRVPKAFLDNVPMHESQEVQNNYLGNPSSVHTSYKQHAPARLTTNTKFDNDDDLIINETPAAYRVKARQANIETRRVGVPDNSDDEPLWMESPRNRKDLFKLNTMEPQDVSQNNADAISTNLKPVQSLVVNPSPNHKPTHLEWDIIEQKGVNGQRLDPVINDVPVGKGNHTQTTGKPTYGRFGPSTDGYPFGSPNGNLDQYYDQNLAHTAAHRLQQEDKLAKIQKDYDDHTFLYKLDRKLVEDIRLKKEMFLREKEGRRLRDLAMFEEIEKVVLLEKCKQLLQRNHQLEELVEKLADDNALLRQHGAQLTSVATERLAGFSKEAAFNSIGKDTKGMMNDYYRDEATDNSLRKQIAEHKDIIENLLRDKNKLEQEKRSLASLLEYQKHTIVPNSQQLQPENVKHDQKEISPLSSEVQGLAQPLVTNTSQITKTAVGPRRSLDINDANTMPKPQAHLYSQLGNDGGNWTKNAYQNFQKFATSSNISTGDFLSKSIAMDPNLFKK